MRHDLDEVAERLVLLVDPLVEATIEHELLGELDCPHRGPPPVVAGNAGGRKRRRGAVDEQAEEAFLHALLDVLRAGREHVGQLRALGLHQDLLSSSLARRPVAAKRLRQAADATREHRETLQVGNLPRHGHRALGSSTISIAMVVPAGLLGDHTLAFASWKNPIAVFASSTERMCGSVNPSAPAASTSLTRARVSSTPSRSMVGMRTSSVLRGPGPA